MKAIKAWLLTWEGTLGPCQHPNNQIISILSSRTSQKTVKAIVDVVYCRSILSAYDMASLANRHKDRERQFELNGSQEDRILYGLTDLFVFARKVSNLKVELDETQKIEMIEWCEMPYIEWKMQGSTPFLKEIEPAQTKKIIREIDEPLSSDRYDFYDFDE